MASTPESSKTPVKPDESTDIPDDLLLDDLDESSFGDPIVIEAEAVEDPIEDDILEENPDSEDIAESFPPSSEPASKRSSFFPMVLGGLVAGAIGFLAAYALVPGLSVDRDQMATLAANAEETASDLADLSARVEEMGSSIPEPVDTSRLESAVTSLQDQTQSLASDLSKLENAPEVDLTGLTSGLAALGDRVTALEINEGNTTSAEAAAAEESLEAFKVELGRLIDEAQAQVSDAEKRAAEIEAQAAAAAAAAEREAQLSKLKAAVDGGAPYNELIAELGDVPAELAAHADKGVPTLVVLQQTFPDAARAALATAQTVPEDASTGQRLTAFLRRQTNARSLTPKEGNDTDAVLSRAEAHLGEGQLPEALAELAALPDTAQSVMSAWLTDAKTRMAALQAVDTLSAATN